MLVIAMGLILYLQKHYNGKATTENHYIKHYRDECRNAHVQEDTIKEVKEVLDAMRKYSMQPTNKQLIEIWEKEPSNFLAELEGD